MVHFGTDRHNLQRYKLTTPYIAIFLMIGLVGYQASTYLFAETTTGKMELTVEQPVYNRGEPVRFTLHNHSSSPVYVINNCPGEPLEVYRQQAGQWQRIHERANDAKCQGAPRQYPIAAQSRVSATYNFWPGLFDEAGRYRIVAPVEPTGDRPVAEFEVR